jgi:hypothetical protein
MQLVSSCNQETDTGLQCLVVAFRRQTGPQKVLNGVIMPPQEHLLPLSNADLNVPKFGFLSHNYDWLYTGFQLRRKEPGRLTIVSFRPITSPRSLVWRRTGRDLVIEEMAPETAHPSSSLLSRATNFGPANKASSVNSLHFTWTTNRLVNDDK